MIGVHSLKHSNRMKVKRHWQPERSFCRNAEGFGWQKGLIL